MDKQPPSSTADSKNPYDLNQIQAKLQLLPIYKVGYEFTEDEIEVLLECNHHAFYHRSFPYATFLGLGTYYAIQKGFLQPNRKYGAKPKVALAIIIGYILGKISYQGICMQKLLNHPGSKFAKEFRESQRYRMEQASLMQTIKRNVHWILSGFSLIPLRRMSLFKQQNEHDEVVNENEHMDDLPVRVEVSTMEKRSYDELRKKNREEYAKHQLESALSKETQQEPVDIYASNESL